MKRTALYTPSIWGAAALIVFTAMMGLADALLVAWWVGSVWGTAGAAGAIVGLVISIAWALRHYLPAVSIGMLATAVAMTILLAHSSPSAGLFSVFVAFGVWGITTASRQTPTDLSGYDLLVLGAQAYNWCPARPIVDYVDRVGNLKAKPVVVIVSGGGMTERATRVLQTCIVKAGGVIVDAIEIWTSRSNEDRDGLTDPVAIMRWAGARATLAPQRKTA